jgi:hypothetical protein
MRDRHGVCQVTDRAYRSVWIDYLKKAALLQRLPIIQVWGKRLKTASLKPHRIIVDLIDDVIGSLGKGFLGSSDTIRNQKPLAKRGLSVGRFSFANSTT